MATIATTTNDVTKLPKWAQEYIRKVERERDTAVRALNEYVDNQTPAPFYIDELESIGEQRGPSQLRRYIQAHGMRVHHAGVYLDITLRDGEIDLQWNGNSSFSLSEIAFIPSSHQSARLVAKENMR